MKLFAFRIVLLVCYLTFFAQFYTLTREYLRFRTSTRVTYQVDDIIAVPASSICFRGLAPMWEMHKKTFKNTSGFYERSYNLDGSWLDFELGRQCKAFGEKYTYSNVTHPSKMTVSDKARLGCLLHYYDNPSVRQYLSGRMFNEYFLCVQGFIKQARGGASSCRNVSRFCEYNDFVLGLVYPLNTCLSLYVKDNDCLQIDKEGNYVIEFYRENVFLYDDYWFQLHEAKRTPRRNSMILFNPDYSYWIRYSRIVVSRMKPPYDTGCRRYHASNEQEPVSQSDCEARCFADSLLKNASLGVFSPLFNYAATIMRQELFPEEAMMSDLCANNITDINFEVFRPLELECEKRCQADCTETFYVFKAIKHGNQREKTRILILHDSEADLRYEHFETIGFLEYLGSVGGVAGMWVGVSLASLFRAALNSIFHQLGRWHEKGQESRIGRPIPGTFLANK